MRCLLSLAVYAALTVSSFAQAPKEVPVTNLIELKVGDIRAFRIEKPFAKLEAPGKNIEIVPEDDRTFSLRALAPGTTMLTAYAPDDGSIVYRGFISVAGGMVRIYGTDADADFSEHVCTELGCNPVIRDQKQPNSASIATTRRNRRGEITTTTKNY